VHGPTGITLYVLSMVKSLSRFVQGTLRTYKCTLKKKCKPKKTKLTSGIQRNGILSSEGASR